jgi:hypothetical protein
MINFGTIVVDPRRRRISTRARTFLVCASLIVIPGGAAWVSTFVNHTPQVKRTEIYRGVYYQCTQGQNGAIHLLEVDLSRPNVQLFLTPVNPDALARGHEYRLDYVRNVARAEGLAIAVNGPMFASDSYLLPMVGDFATSRDTIVANHKLNHLNPNNFLIWFDEALRPKAESSRPAPLNVLEKAQWAIGGIDLSVNGGRKYNGDGSSDKRCLIGIDHERMWLGIFESATQTEAVGVLMRAGAKYVMMMDGGDSTSLYLGGRTRGVPNGLRFGGQRPVATVIGIKADPILDPI